MEIDIYCQVIKEHYITKSAIEIVTVPILQTLSSLFIHFHINKVAVKLPNKKKLKSQSSIKNHFRTTILSCSLLIYKFVSIHNFITSYSIIYHYSPGCGQFLYNIGSQALK